MKKYWNLFIFISLLSLFSCLEDESAYAPQQKEDVNIDDNFQVDTTDSDKEVPPGQLAPGVHLVTLKVLQPNSADSIERRFKYYMPVTLDIKKPISLVFDFHGSYSFEAGQEPADPISGIKDSDPLNQKALKANSIICYPAALPIYTNTDSSGTVNWLDSENHLPFVDAMLKYFTEDIVSPRLDPNRVYSTGHSSGAIYSFYLAFYRSDKFAAITPRAGQMRIDNEGILPKIAVPVRVFAGEKDDIVRHSAVISNMTAWAEEIGGYFAADMQMDTIIYEDYADVTIRYWHGGNTDYEIYSLAGIDHGIAVSYCVDDMWDFMESHTLDHVTENLFVTSSIKRIDAQCGEPFTFNISCTEGATIAMSDVPKGWNTKLEGRIVTLTAPKAIDYYSDIDRDGSIVFTATKGDQTTTCKVDYLLAEPKLRFEVGDIYYNDNFEPIGVVFWVNRSNIKEAKIINIDIQKGILYSGNGNGLGINFHTPDPDNGKSNTEKMVQQNNSVLTEKNAAFMWASSYSYKQVGGWYLPANNELVALGANITKVNAVINSFKGVEITKTLWSSTNEVKTGEKTKTLYYYDLSTKQIVGKKASDEGEEYIGYAAQARAIKIVTK